MKDLSFAELYRRSRYFSRPRPSDDADKKEMQRKEMQRLEEFVTAALAFVLRHDADFRNAFLRKVCGLKNLSGERFEVEVQSDHSAGSGKFDLVLTSEGWVVVIEAKVRAPLEPHQNPKEEDFLERRTRNGKVGYGWQMINNSDWAGKHLIYVVLKPGEETCARKAQRIKARFARWCELDGRSKSSLLASLMAWLGSLGIEGLMKHNCEKVKLAKFLNKAWEMQSLLEAVRADSGLETGRVVFRLGEESPHIGCVILKNSLALTHLRKFASPSGKELGWFGYDLDESGSPKPCVWFYVGSEEKASRLRKMYPGSIRNTDSNDLIWYQRSTSEGDFEWLIKRLNGFKSGAKTRSK